MSKTNIEHLSYSTCKKIYRKGIDYALGTKLGLIDETFGKAADLGIMIHAYILGGDPQWVESPYKNFRKKEAQEWRDSQTKIILTRDEIEQIEKTGLAISRHPLAAELLNSCESEQKLTAKVEGVEFLGYADGISKDRKTIFDLKTTAQFDAFKWQAFKNDFDLQASVYRLFGDNADYFFIVAETVAPYRVQVFGTSEEFFENGNRKLQHAIEEFKMFRARPGDTDLERINFNVGETKDLTQVESLGDWSN
jgi:hypothetical protein